MSDPSISSQVCPIRQRLVLDQTSLSRKHFDARQDIAPSSAHVHVGVCAPRQHLVLSQPALLQLEGDGLLGRLGMRRSFLL